MAETSTEQLQIQIKEAGEALGRQMDTAIPLRPSRVAAILHTNQISERVLIPVEGEEGTFTRAWLERRAAIVATKSPVQLLTDTVSVDPSLSNQSNQFASNPNVAAVYDPSSGTEVDHELGTSQEAILSRIGVLGTYVTAIAEAELHRELKRAVPVHGLKFQESVAS